MLIVDIHFIYYISNIKLLLEEAFGMKKKIIGIFICTLFFSIAIPVTGINDINNNDSIFINDNLSPTLIEEDWWPMYNHDLQNSGYSSADAPDTGVMKWIFNVHSDMCSPAVYNGMVYVGDGYGNVYCLNMDTSEIIWEFQAGGSIQPRVTPTIADGKLFIGSENGKVFCLNAETGKEIWMYEIGEWVESSPAVIDGRVYVGAYDNKLYCLDGETGGKIWDYPTGGSIITSPAFDEGNIFFGSFDKKVYCLNALTGTKLWDYETNDIIQSTSPSISAGKLFIGSDDDNLYCLDAVTGDKIWDYTTTGDIHSTPALAYSYVYFGSEDGNMYCIDAETGDKIWAYNAGNVVHSSPSVADDKIYFGSSGTQGKIFCLNAQTGELIWDYPKASWSSPAISNGKLFVGCYNFYCFEDGPYHPPNTPEINGPTNGKPETTYDFTFVSNEPNGDDVYYYIKWGDGTVEEWIGPFLSGEEVILKHAFPKRQEYTIKAKAKDIYGLESDWGQFLINLPRLRSHYYPILMRFIDMFPILKFLLKNIF
jgi:outer membrane protein assembly factor BamB